MKRMKVFGLTGSIACGKSLTAEMLAELGAVVVDSDIIARDVVKKGSPVLKEIEKVFGKQVLNPDGSLNRAVMGSIVFNDAGKLKKLNEIIHPAIIKEMENEIKKNKEAGTNVLIFEVPLLYEAGFKGLVEKVIVVHSEESSQVQRLMERNNLSSNEALVRIRSQIPSYEKAKRADYVINNSLSIDSLKSEVKKLWDEISK